MRWYNPKLQGFEWIDVPESDEEAVGLLEGCTGSEQYVEVYGHWRTLGASIMAALIRAGDAARERGEG